MIRTKTAFFIFLILCIILFPYWIIYLQFDYLSSIVPGWNTTIITGQIISNTSKFLILTVITIYYWKLSSNTNQLNFKKFLVHFLMTIPAVFIERISLYELLNFNSLNADSFVNWIQIIFFINICYNILFIIGQILFGIYYVKLKNKS